MDTKIIEEKAINLSQVKEEIKNIKKRDTELGFRTAKVAEHLDLVSVIKLKDTEEILESILKLDVPRLKEMHIHKIIDLMPKNMVELKNIIQSYALTINNEKLEKILEIISEYQKKK